MTQQKMVYWKRKKEAEGQYISGYCRADSVPSYGEVKEEDIPQEISISVDEAGNITALSPPVIGTRTAYRYHLYLPVSKKHSIAEETDFAISLMLDTFSAESPARSASRENWWWYAKDRFERPLRKRAEAPISLMKKWKRGMLEILLEHHPEKEIKLAQWDLQVANHKAYVARNSRSRPPARKKVHNDMVVLPRPIHFQSGAPKQIFQYKVKPGVYGARAKHSLTIGDTNYRTPHSKAIAFPDGVVAEEQLEAPIRAAMALIAWSNFPVQSAHDYISAETKFAPLEQQTLEDLEAWIAEDTSGKDIQDRVQHLDAAISALWDFMPGFPEDRPDTPSNKLIDLTLDKMNGLRDRLTSYRNSLSI